MPPMSRPRVIADSDDEDGGDYSPPASPQTQLVGEASVPTRSSDHQSHDTSSTDLMFFQSVYNEQIHAAHEQAGRFKRGQSGEDMMDLIVNAADDTSKDASGTVDAVDIWDVPESPKSKRPSHAQARERERLISQHQTGEGNAGGFDDAGYVAVESLGNENDQGSTSSTREKKRRKVDRMSNAGLDSDSVELIPLQSSNNLTSTELLDQQLVDVNCPDSTLPPDAPSFFIAQDTLTESQKLSYEAISLPSSGVTEQPQAYPDQPTYQLRLASSGSATNINTPRSRIASSLLPSTAPWSQDALAAAHQETMAPARPRRDSSPDIISLAVPVPSSKPAQPLSSFKDTTHEDAHEDVVLNNDPDIAASNKPSPSEFNPETPRAQVALNNTSSTQGKKKRGRPRKNEVSEPEPGAVTPVKTSPNIEMETSTKGKKKRGRPKKQSIPSADETPPPADAPKEEPLEEPTTRKEEETKKVAAKLAAVSPALTAQMGQIHEPESSASEQKPSPRAQSPSHRGAQQGSTTKEESTLQSEGKAEVSKDRKAIKTATSVAKPIYRVGLSKRSRIAPLLKCLRK